MNKLKKEDIKPAVFELYNEYAHNRLSYKDFLMKLSTYAVDGLTADQLISFLSPDYRYNLQIEANDSRIDSKYIEFSSPKGGGIIKGFLSMPKGNIKKLGGLIIAHENRGLNPHIEDVARRATLAG